MPNICRAANPAQGHICCTRSGRSASQPSLEGRLACMGEGLRLCAMATERVCMSPRGPRQNVPGPPYMRLPSTTLVALKISDGSTTYIPSSRRRATLRWTALLFHIAAFMAGTKTTGAVVAATVRANRSVQAPAAILPNSMAWRSPISCRAFCNAIANLKIRENAAPTWI